ncbi:MAG: hypothetical protein K0S23_2817 [Fluviicola sp.]|jgi:hypothetical protein|nr:hypothetical protein [Fluviicola sp.]
MAQKLPGKIDLKKSFETGPLLRTEVMSVTT